MKLTDKQIKLMRHTTSDPNRNWFGTGFGNEDSKEFEKLIISGHAKKSVPPSWVINEVVYHLTKKGKEAIDKIDIKQMRDLK